MQTRSQCRIITIESCSESEKVIVITFVYAHFDKNCISRGQLYYANYRSSIDFGTYVGFVTVLSIESILETMSCTNKSSTPATAYKRYAETILYIDYFYRDLPDDPNSL